MPLSTARKMLPYLNLVGEHGVLPSSLESSAGLTTSIEHIYRRSLVNSYHAASPSVLSSSHTFGYVTQDLCPGLGDDVLHRPLPAVWQPTFVSTELPDGGDDERVDIVFFDFIQPDILSALNTLQRDKTFSPKDVGLYITEFTANTLMQTYAASEWN